uniref:ISXO2-like transposase domain-containing protein n=1 Tax=Amphimedon queenslandica TaxID=400682 RepID=A0A1X7SY89_AMPQE
SVIYSDLWGANNGLDRLLGQNYTHHIFNHSQHFVDPVTGAHTQPVELMWSQCKRMVRKTQTMHSQLFHTYLPEFMWRKKFDGRHQNAFNNIISSIVE